MSVNIPVLYQSLVKLYGEQKPSLFLRLEFIEGQGYACVIDRTPTLHDCSELPSLSKSVHQQLRTLIEQELPENLPHIFRIGEFYIRCFHRATRPTDTIEIANTEVYAHNEWCHPEMGSYWGRLHKFY